MHDPDRQDSDRRGKQPSRGEFEVHVPGRRCAARWLWWGGVSRNVRDWWNTPGTPAGLFGSEAAHTVLAVHGMHLVARGEIFRGDGLAGRSAAEMGELV